MKGWMRLTYEDHLRDEGVVDASACEDGRAVVEEILWHLVHCRLELCLGTHIGSSELLEHLQPHSNCQSIRHLRRLPHPNPLLDSTSHYFFSRELCLHFLQLHLDTIMVFRNTIHARHCLGCGIDFPMPEVEPRRFGEEENADSENYGPYERQTHGDLPGRSFTRLVLFSGVVEYSS